MKKLSIILVCMLIFSFSASNAVFASTSSVTATYDYSDNTIEIIGKTSNGAGVPVTVCISELDDSDLFADDAAPLATFLAFTAADGSVNCKNRFSSDMLESRMYYISIITPSDRASCDILVFNPNNEGTLAVVSKANSETDTKAFADYLKTDNNIEKVGFKYSDVESYLGKIADFAIKYKAENKVTYSLNSFINIVKYVMIMSDAQNGIDADDCMLKYAAALNCTYDEWASLDSDVQKEIGKLMSDSDYLGDYIYIDFDELVLVAEARCESVSWATLKELLLSKSDEYGLDTEKGSKYAKISKTDVQKVFYNMLSDTKKAIILEDIQDAFDDAVDDVYSDTKGGSSSSGSSSGSSKGSSKGGVIASGSLTPTDMSQLPDNSEVEVTPEPVPTPDTVDLSDIEGHFAQNEIKELVKIGAVSGYEDGSFKPGNAVTRAEFASIAYKAFGFEPSNENIGFTDVNSNDWYADAVNALAASGIVKGSDGAFRPGDVITRQEASVIMARIASYKGIVLEEGSVEFEDADMISDYAKDSVNALGANGIIKGFDGMFRPADSITRGETAVVIFRLIEFK